jgi:hypothetical protein
MRTLQLSRLCGAAVVACGIAGLSLAAQSQSPTAGQSPAGGQAAAASQQKPSADQDVTIAGCIQSEADYRKAQDAGRGGVAGTGVGVGNEFVLSNATIAKGGAGSSATTKGMAYELTGANEAQAAKHVGHRVEITGKLKAAEVGASGAPTGGPTAGKPPAGVDVTSKDLQLRELEVVSIKMVSDTCPAS